MSLEEILVIIDSKDKQYYDYAFSMYNKFTICGNIIMRCESASPRQHKRLEITVCNDEPTLENIIEFLSFAQIDILTHFDYKELVGEESFFPKVKTILDFLEGECSNLRNLSVQFQGNPNDLTVSSHYLFPVVNYRNLDYFVIKMDILEDLNTVHVIEYKAKKYLTVDGNYIKRQNCGSDFLFHWDKTTHRPVRTLELYDCSFLQKFDIIYLFDLFKDKLINLALDIMLPDIFFLYLDWCQSLESLYIGFNDKGSFGDLTGITELSFLKKLTFDNLPITARLQVKKLFNDESMKTLQILKFENCPCIDDSCLKIISSNCVELQSIGITCFDSKSEISDYGIISILHNSRSLTRLELDNTTGIDGSFLASARKLFPQLKNVKLTNCSIKSSVCQAEYDKYASEFVRYVDPEEEDFD